MADRVETAYVKMWGTLVGAVAWDRDRGFATFEFDRPFLEMGLDLAPLEMPIDEARGGNARFEFRTLPKATFRGLPGLLADALPDRFGDRIINRWLAHQGRDPGDFSAVERLCYTGKRATGALEFSPVINEQLDRSEPVEVGELVELAQEVIDERSKLDASLADDPTDAMLDIIRVGTSAGGGRPKAVIAINDATQEVRTGQADAPEGFAHWILKFDGVTDRELGDPAGYGRIEYAYHLMAVDAGIKMTECRLFKEGGRAHFMTRRFDRPSSSDKLHQQSLCAMAHFDFNEPGGYSYEQAFQVMRRLRLPYEDTEQQYRRMVFNFVARNQDDHTKNIAYLMDHTGAWRLSPAYDVIYAYNPAGQFTSMHQMSINGKRDGITRDDLLSVGKEMSVKQGGSIIDDVVEAVSNWPEYAKDACVDPAKLHSIGEAHRLV
jgi:serine/threonine-protein kinase HipA